MGPAHLPLGRALRGEPTDNLELLIQRSDGGETASNRAHRGSAILRHTPRDERGGDREQFGGKERSAQARRGSDNDERAKQHLAQTGHYLRWNRPDASKRRSAKLIAAFEAEFGVELPSFSKYPSWILRRALVDQWGFAEVFKQLTGLDNINHVVNVDFNGFADAVNAIAPAVEVSACSASL